MPAPDIDNSDGPSVGYRGLETVTIGADDVTFPSPRTVRIVAPASGGNLVFIDSLGREHTLNGVSAGADAVGPGDGLVYVRTIRGSSTVTRVLTGIV